MTRKKIDKAVRLEKIMLDKRVICPECMGYGNRGINLTPWIKSRTCILCKGTGYVLESERKKISEERRMEDDGS